MLLGVSIFWGCGEVRADIRDFLRGPREKERGRERERVVDARMQSMDSYIPYIYLYMHFLHLSQR